MDEQAGSRPAAPHDPVFHGDDELAAALSAQLDRLIETGAIPLTRERAVPEPAPAADATPAAADPAATASGAASEAPTRATEPAAQPRTGSTPLVPPPAHRATTPAPAPTEHHAHRGEHRADQPPVRGTHRAPTGPTPSQMPAFADLPETEPITLPELAEPELPRFLTGPIPTSPPTGPPLPTRRARRLRERAEAAGDTGSVDLLPADAPAEREEAGPADDSAATGAQHRPEEAIRLVPVAAAAVDRWTQSLRIVGPPLDDDERRGASGDAGAPTTGPIRFDEPLPTTGSIRVPLELTEPALADVDEDAEIDEVASDFRQARAADTAAIGVLPPMVQDTGHHVPPVSRGSLDRERMPEVVPRLPTPGSNAGVLAPLATWAGVTGSPLAIILGFGLGGGGGTVAGLVIGLALALPAMLRLAQVGARHGGDAVAAARSALGSAAGTVGGVVLLVARLGIAALGLLGVADVAASYAGRTGLGGWLPGSAAAIVAVLVAGLLSLVVAGWPERVVGVVLGAAGAIGVFASTALLALGAGAAGSSGARGSLPAGLVAAFALVGLVVASGAAEVSRRPLSGTRWPGAVAGTGLGAVVGSAVIALGVLEGGGGPDAAARFVVVVVDATSVALVGPIAVLLLLGSLALVATAARGAGSAAVSLLGQGRSVALGTAAAALVAIALALAALAVGLGASDALTRFGPLVGIPLAAVLAAVVAGPRARQGTGVLPLVVLVGAVLVGLLLVDGLLVPGERGPLLDLLGLPVGAHWRAAPVIGLVVGAVGGAAAGLLAHDRTPERAQDAPERLAAEAVPTNARK